MAKKSDLVIPVDFMESMDKYNTEEIAKMMHELCEAMVEQFKIKDSDYDGSWQKDGLLSVHFNFKRKVDRVLAQFNNGTLTSDNNENIADTLIDLATYSLMYSIFLGEKNKNVSEFLAKFRTKFMIKTQKGNE